MNKLLYAVGSSLIEDQATLKKWLSGIQHNFADLYITSRHLAENTMELEVLKEFLATKID